MNLVVARGPVVLRLRTTPKEGREKRDGEKSNQQEQRFLAEEDTSRQIPAVQSDQAMPAPMPAHGGPDRHGTHRRARLNARAATRRQPRSTGGRRSSVMPEPVESRFGDVAPEPV